MPEWKYYTGTFTTNAKTERIVLMFFVYGLEGRDVEEGASFVVEDPPPAFPPKGAQMVSVPKKQTAKDRLPYLREEGYRPHQGKVRLWDLGKDYGRRLSMGFVGWKNRKKMVADTLWQDSPRSERRCCS